jgi:hypothetical protein
MSVGSWSSGLPTSIPKPDVFKTMREYVLHFGANDTHTIVLGPEDGFQDDGDVWYFTQGSLTTTVYMDRVLWFEEREFQLKERPRDE